MNGNAYVEMDVPKLTYKLATYKVHSISGVMQSTYKSQCLTVIRRQVGAWDGGTIVFQNSSSELR